MPLSIQWVNATLILKLKVKECCMLKRDKRSFTEEEQRECWQLWLQGLGFSDIARELGSKPGTIFGVIRLNGGYSPP